MSFTVRTIGKRLQYFDLLKPIKFNERTSCCFPIIHRNISEEYHVNNQLYSAPRRFQNRCSYLPNIRNYCSSKDCRTPEQKPSLIQRFKQMYRDYWYVLVPVHVVTSAVWFGGFYYIVSSGTDIPSMLESLGMSEKIIKPMRDSTAGYWALTYALYKIATPIRYTVTLGGTTVAINHLTAAGYIQPVPSRERLKEIMQEKKEDIQEAYQGTKQELRQRRDQIKERKAQVMEDLRRYKEEMADIKKNEMKNKKDKDL